MCVCVELIGAPNERCQNLSSTYRYKANRLASHPCDNQLIVALSVNPLARSVKKQIPSSSLVRAIASDALRGLHDSLVSPRLPAARWSRHLREDLW